MKIIIYKENRTKHCILQIQILLSCRYFFLLTSSSYFLMLQRTKGKKRKKRFPRLRTKRRKRHFASCTVLGRKFVRELRSDLEDDNETKCDVRCLRPVFMRSRDFQQLLPFAAIWNLKTVYTYIFRHLFIIAYAYIY